MGCHTPPSQSFVRPYILRPTSLTKAPTHNSKLLVMADKRVSDVKRYQLKISLSPPSLHRAPFTRPSAPHSLQRKAQLIPTYTGRTQALAHRMQYHTCHLTCSQEDQITCLRLPVESGPSRFVASLTQERGISMLQQSPRKIWQ